MKIVQLIQEISTSNVVSEEDIVAAIKSMNAAAVASGFRLVKENTNPGKGRTVHAMWVHQPGNKITAPYVSLMWSKSDGLHVVAQPSENSKVERSPNGYVYGTTEEWSNPEKWKEIK